MTEARQHSVSEHYARPALAETIYAGIEAAGLDPDRLSYSALNAVDHFHTLGQQASEQLAALAQIQPGSRVLDVGGGLGGPARMLAAEYDCEVTVLDLTEAYCRIGTDLTQRVGLGHKVKFQQGDALQLPFDDESFDLVWTQHCTMNIEDKPRLYQEIVRVLRTHGTLASHEIMAGKVQPIHFPVPWAETPALSFLLSTEQVRALLEQSGLQVRAFRDDTATACAWYREKFASAPATPPPLGLHLLVGEHSPRVFENVLRNYEEERTAVIQLICEKVP